ncbi:MAG: CoA transferase subunit A [Deltaproteobacteria bacterium]|nr:CoA transferase subunit A [Deltaproteobacteria bacterium]MBW1815532.1 CoA transferase subunit A [Deltaproteobacteria bacterium]MBW2284157.1 CoA transferase subunit A [Deltaproteobacteria bacterium]
MKDDACSGIRGITSLSRDEINKNADTEFEFWGPTPGEARAKAVAKKKGMRDKRTTLKEAVARYVKDGINLGIGGFVNTRVPVAIIHEIIRHGARGLTLSFQSNSICCELLAGAMILNPDHVSIRRIELAWYGYEVIGIAPLLRYLTVNGMVELDDYTNYGMSARFKAGAMGIPFMPTRDHGGTDMELVNRGKMVECPFTKENIYLVPACHPDVGIVHVSESDMYGNSRIFGALCTCPEIAQAAVNTIVTAEQIISNDMIRNHPNLTEIPYPAVDAVVEQPYGSTPGASYGYYWFDMPGFLEFRSICEEFRVTGNKDKLRQYYDTYIYGCETFDDFLKQMPEDKLRQLDELDGDQPIIFD